jgi:Ca-activated chloride channel family protein
MKTRLFLMAATLLGLLLATVAPAAADGIIIPDRPEMNYLTVKYHRVTVTIEDQVATTRIDQVFVNESRATVEGTYFFPLPEEAAISEFSMWVDGKRMEGQVLTREKARQIYDDIVRRRRDPALLEYVGHNLFQASVFPIPPGAERRIEIEYRQVLQVEGGLVRYVYPLSTEKFSARPLEEASVSVSIVSKEPIKAIYSPSHPVAIDREDDTHASAGWEGRNVRPDKDFSLYYTVSQDKLGVNLLSYKERRDDGFFLLLVAPKVEVDKTQVIAKDVIVVLDTSGSMEGEKMDQAKDALRFVLDHLNPEDRFNIVQFSTRVNTYADSLQPPQRARDAAAWVRSLEAGGSTDIDRAMLEALDMADRERPTIVIFLTDGLPTAGTVETDLILSDVKQAARSNMRVFTFGVGDDVNTVLLDSMAREMRGASAYVRPGERIDEQVSAFYSKVSTPVLADVKLTFRGVRVDDTYPDPLPDLFAGTQLVLVGRYTGNGPATVTLEGTVNGEQQRFAYEGLTFRAQGGDDFIAPLWATRKIGYLLNQIRLHGESKEMVDEIVDLSIRYGIVTPYTSFLVEEPNRALSQEGRRDIATRSYGAAATASPAPASGAAAVQKAQDQGQMEAAQAPAAPAEAYAQQVQIVGDRAFVLRDGVWTDTTFDTSTMTATKLDFGSDAFFQLLADHPEAGRYFALGERVIVVIDGVAYETVASGGVSQLPTPQAPAATPEEPIATPQSSIATPSIATPPSRTSSVPADAAGAPYTQLSADVVEGVAPLTVNFGGQLVGGSDNNRDFYCVESTFDFGDGETQTASPVCGEWTASSTIQRQFNASYVYDKPGTYRATFSLDRARSEPLTIVVRAKGEAPVATSTPIMTDYVTPEGGQRATGGLCAGPLGLLLVPLLGLALAGRRT